MYLLAFAESSIQLFPDATLILHIILILVMIWVLNRTLFRPINAILERRDRFKGGTSSEAAEMLGDVAKKEERYNTETLAARNQGYELIANEQQQGTAAREAQINSARNDAAAKIEQGKAEIETQTAAARAEIGANAEKLAEKIAANILEAK